MDNREFEKSLYQRGLLETLLKQKEEGRKEKEEEEKNELQKLKI